MHALRGVGNVMAEHQFLLLQGKAEYECVPLCAGQPCFAPKTCTKDKARATCATAAAAAVWAPWTAAGWVTTRCSYLPDHQLT